MSEVYIVIAKFENSTAAFLVEDGTPGLSFGVPEQKMGWRN